jgi:hypothetical protein
MNIDWGNLIYSALPILLGVGFIWVKIGKILKALMEFAEVITTINSALADKDLTKEEVAEIKIKIGDAIQAFKDILKK